MCSRRKAVKFAWEEVCETLGCPVGPSDRSDSLGLGKSRQRAPVIEVGEERLMGALGYSETKCNVSTVSRVEVVRLTLEVKQNGSP